MPAKNLLFLMTDQQRYDTIGLKVGDEDVTPTLNRLAASSASFQRAYNACPLCMPARTALATGRSPLSTGICLNDLEGRVLGPMLKDRREPETLHTLLHAAGYQVAHVGVDHLRTLSSVKDRLPFSFWADDDSWRKDLHTRGYDTARSPLDVQTVLELADGAPRPQAYSNSRVSLWPHPTETQRDLWFTDKAVQWLRSRPAQPFALFLCLWAPHPPLQVPAEYLQLFDPDKIELPANTGRPAEGEPRSRRKGAPAQLGAQAPEGGWKKAWQAHCALSRLCDDQLAMVLQALKDTGADQDTLVVFTTDHGEHLGQHAMYQKMEMYEAAVRVPAIFHVPGMEPASLSTPVSHLDFLPTVLELLNLKPHDGAEGRSLAASVLRAEEPGEEDVFSVYCGNHRFGDIRRMIVRGQYKYVWDGAEAELFNLHLDPDETVNLAGDPACQALCGEMHGRLKAWAETRGDGIPWETTINVQEKS